MEADMPLVEVDAPLHVPSSGAPVPLPAPGSGPAAVIVYHGMGQQVPFETLGGVARMLLREAAARDGAAPGPVTCRTVQLGPQRVPRVEITLPDGKGGRREVHLYEAYWAPLMEGRITLGETMAFLWEAGLRGLRASWNRASLDRWLFGELHAIEFARGRGSRWGLAAALVVLMALTLSLFELPPLWIVMALLPCLLVGLVNTTTRYLLYAAAVVAALTVMNGVIAAVTASRVLGGGHGVGARLGPVAVGALTSDLVTGLALLLATGLSGIVLPMLLRARAASPADAPEGKWPAPAAFGPAARMVWRGLAAWALLSLVATAIAFAARLAGVGPSGLWSPARAAGSAGGPWILGGLWLPLLWVTGWMRRWIVEFMGDVAVYVSSHKCNRFAETRQKIREAVSALTGAVYGARQEGGAALLYSDVLIVGHSLGSVIAYDALNAALNQDWLDGGPLHVTRRTPLLLTFGSPLDKTAFLFRTQLGKIDRLREALAAAQQPLILDPAHRPARWVNLYSPDDWVSGRLEFYDDPRWPDGDPRKVLNLEDADATTPGASHNEYWSNPLLRRTLYNALLP